MISAQFELLIRRQPREVVDVMTRFEDIPRFVPRVISAEQTSPGPVGVGTTFVQRGRLFGQSIETPTTVTTYQPPNRFGYRGEGAMPYEAQYTFTAVPDGTRLTADVVFLPSGAMRLVEPVLALPLKRVYRTNLERLRRLVE